MFHILVRWKQPSSFTWTLLCRQKEFVHSLILFQHGNIKAVAPTAIQGMHANGESSSLGESHPPSLQVVGANGESPPCTPRQPIRARDTVDSGLTNGGSDYR